MTKIIAAGEAPGRRRQDIQTVGLNLYPQYANGSSTQIAGYTISEQLQVTVRDLDNAGDVVDTAMAKGANRHERHLLRARDPRRP